jgi:hypothetical protein
MTLKTLQNLEKELNYLLKDGTLEEVLTFLGIQYFEGSLKRGNENKVVYEFLDTKLKAIEISISDDLVILYGYTKSGKGLLRSRSFWVWLDQHYGLLFLRLIYLLNKRYGCSYSGLEYKVNIYDELFDLEVNTSILNNLGICQLSLLSDSDLEKLYS